MNKIEPVVRIPDGLDDSVRAGLKEVRKLHREKLLPRISVGLGGVAMAALCFIVFGIANPSAASKVPIIGGMFAGMEGPTVPGGASHGVAGGDISEDESKDGSAYISEAQTVTESGVTITAQVVKCDGLTATLELDITMENGIGGDIVKMRDAMEQAYGQDNSLTKEYADKALMRVSGKVQAGNSGDDLKEVLPMCWGSYLFTSENIIGEQLSDNEFKGTVTLYLSDSIDRLATDEPINLKYDIYLLDATMASDNSISSWGEGIQSDKKWSFDFTVEPDVHGLTVYGVEGESPTTGYGVKDVLVYKDKAIINSYAPNCGEDGYLDRDYLYMKDYDAYAEEYGGEENIPEDTLVYMETDEWYNEAKLGRREFFAAVFDQDGNYYPEGELLSRIGGSSICLNMDTSALKELRVYFFDDPDMIMQNEYSYGGEVLSEDYVINTMKGRSFTIDLTDPTEGLKFSTPYPTESDTEYWETFAEIDSPDPQTAHSSDMDVTAWLSESDGITAKIYLEITANHGFGGELQPSDDDGDGTEEAFMYLSLGLSATDGVNSYDQADYSVGQSGNTFIPIYGEQISDTEFSGMLELFLTDTNTSFTAGEDIKFKLSIYNIAADIVGTDDPDTILPAFDTAGIWSFIFTAHPDNSALKTIDVSEKSNSGFGVKDIIVSDSRIIIHPYAPHYDESGFLNREYYNSLFPTTDENGESHYRDGEEKEVQPIFWTKVFDQDGNNRPISLLGGSAFSIGDLDEFGVSDITELHIYFAEDENGDILTEETTNRWTEQELEEMGYEHFTVHIPSAAAGSAEAVPPSPQP